MRIGPHDPAEGGIPAAELARVGFARIEEGMADPAAPVVGQENGFGAVEDVREVEAGSFESGAELRAMILHRGSGRGADKACAIEGADDDRLRAVAVGGDVAALVLGVAVIEIGPVAEDLDPEARDIVEHRIERRAGQAADIDRHLDTCRIQSLRL